MKIKRLNKQKKKNKNRDGKPSFYQVSREGGIIKEKKKR
jgi:hypothetical protein